MAVRAKRIMGPDRRQVEIWVDNLHADAAHLQGERARVFKVEYRVTDDMAPVPVTVTRFDADDAMVARPSGSRVLHVDAQHDSPEDFEAALATVLGAYDATQVVAQLRRDLWPYL